jgi:cardiolipin synthase
MQMRVRRLAYLRGWPLWVGVGIVVTSIALLVAQDQETVKVESPVAAADTRFPDYVSSLVGAKLEAGDRYTVLRNGDEVFPAMLAAVAGAKSRISFESFIYEDGAIGDQFTAAFVAAARRGVTVRVVLDAFGSKLATKTQDRLREAGVTFVWFNAFRPWTIENTNYRTHRKVLVVDGDVAFTGGIGIADHWMGRAQDPDHWRDSQFEVAGPTVRALEASFYENWLEAGGGSVPQLDSESPAQRAGSRSIVVWSNPTAGVSNVKLLYLLSIAAARREIDLQSPYVILDESTRGGLDSARRRGVRVRILTESDRTDAKPVKYASRYDYQGLLDAGYEIYEYQPTMMHAKTLTVDGVWSLIGSANFDNRSLELNDEITVAVADRDLAARIRRDFEDDLIKATRLDKETWARRSPLQKSRALFWSFFGELF